MMHYAIQFEPQPHPQDVERLGIGISQHAKKTRGLEPLMPFAFFIRDENHELKGGCNGNVGYGWLYIDQLWVEEALRGKGYGMQCMRLCEAFARQHDCVAMAVNTGDWEALDFYKKNGFRIELERHGLSNQSIFYFLRKDLL